MKEKQKFDRTAEYVCQRVLKIIGAARREGNFNSQLVGELKRWNEKLEVRLSDISLQDLVLAFLKDVEEFLPFDWMRNIK